MRSFIYKSLHIFSKPFIRFNSNNLRVLAYHGVDDISRFENQLRYIKENFSVIDLNLLLKHVFEGKQLPKKALLITFDDGDISVLRNGVPLLKKYSLPSVCFVITSLINTQKPFWWEEIRYYLGKEKGNTKSWEVKNWINEEREAYLERLRRESRKPEITQVQLTTQQLQTMRNSAMEIANHSHTHPMLDKCTGEKVQEEITTSSSILGSLGFVSDIFAYPNGNFDPKVELILKENGTKMAFLFDHKLNLRNINPLRISRIRVDSNTDLKEFKVKVSGLHSLIYNRITKKEN